MVKTRRYYFLLTIKETRTATYDFPSQCFSVLPRTEQDWLVQPGPTRLGMRHPRRRYQRTTAINNNQTQLILHLLMYRVLGHGLPSERTRHHPSFCSQPSRTDSVMWKCPVWVGATSGESTRAQPQSAKAKDYSW
jgi:hypothetical protein